MKILGIDTSTPIGSVALIDGENLVAEHTLNIVQAHSSRLMPAIDRVLKWGNITADALDGCAVGIGPGSFTGIRIGVATIKSLCYALDKPIMGISTLEAVAYNLRWTNGVHFSMHDGVKSTVRFLMAVPNGNVSVMTSAYPLMPSSINSIHTPLQIALSISLVMDLQPTGTQSEKDLAREFTL